MRVAFLNHPLSATPDFDRPKTARGASWRSTANNVSDAYDWMRFLINKIEPKIVVLAPGLSYTTAQVDGSRILAMMAMVMPRCDLVVDVSWFSPHMGIMHNYAQRAGLPVVNLTRWGRLPPTDSVRDQVDVKEINALFAAAQTVKRRAIWMPPLTAEDVMALREAEEKLVLDPDNIDAVQVIRTIINAAVRP